MTEPITDAPANAAVRPQSARRDAIALAIYLLAVQVWSINAGPLGRDFRLLSGDTNGLSHPLASVWIAMVHIFGGFAPAYHFVNLALLYACMLLLYWFVRVAYHDGPRWIATLAAALFMANPAFREATLHLSGAIQLLPCAVGLGTLTLYALSCSRDSLRLRAAAFSSIAAAALFDSSNTALPLACFAYGVIISSDRHIERIICLAAIQSIVLALRPDVVSFESLRPASSIAPLYLVLYPIGFLPEAAWRFHEFPWLGRLAVVSFLAVVGLTLKLARHRAAHFGLVAAIVLRALQGRAGVDWTHLTGAGSMLLPGSLVLVSLVVVFGQIWKHPKWRRGVVRWTTLLALLAFGLQIHAGSIWRNAAREVRDFQAEAVRLAPGGETIGILPDIGAWRGAPIQLSESIRYDTPFSRKVPHVSLLMLSVYPSREDGWTLSSTPVSDSVIEVIITGPDTRYIAPAPFDVLRVGNRTMSPDVIVETLESSRERLRLRIESRNGPFPETLCRVRLP
ncbi:MAG: hypothetical protein AAB353_11755 [Candidatus Hydrogenedentota bacterium]